MTTSFRSTPNWLDRTNGDTWHPVVSREIQEAYAGAEDQAGWETFVDHLKNRRGRPFAAELFASDSPAVLWMLSDRLVGKDTSDLIRKLASSAAFEKPRKRRRWAEVAANWLDAASVASSSMAYACECLAWAHALPRLATCVDENLWWNLLSHLVHLAREACQSSADCDPLHWQLLGGELLLALAYGLPELSFSHDLAPAATATIVAGLDELLDADGVPRGQILSAFPGLMASWTRSQVLARRMVEITWQDHSRRRYEKGLLNLTRMWALEPEMIRACQQLELKKPTKRLLRRLTEEMPARIARTHRKSLPPAAMHSEEARIAVLRPTWAAKAPRLMVNYSGRSVQLELSSGSESILSGEWQLAVSSNGTACGISGEWEHVCWYSDKDVDFLEIEAALENGVQVQRQILLARDDEVLLLSDAILLGDSARLEYHSSLPLGNHVHFEAAEATREGYLLGLKSRKLVLPLALPEWQSDHRRGTLQVAGNRLVLSQTHDGRAAYAPLLIDLNTKRCRKECTWRQLTVAEWRVPQANDVAVGFRAQVGDCNWVLYRSLSGEGIRSLLGQQVKAEFLFGRMKSGGGCARLLEIEPIEE